MKKYKNIKKFGNFLVGTIFIESKKVHPKWRKIQYFMEGGGVDDWLLENHVEDKEYFEQL